jgi:hypothetical protein
MALASLGLADHQQIRYAARATGEGNHAESYSPELIQIMRAALDEVMTKIPLEQAAPGIKAAVAECILKAAANGQTSYDDRSSLRANPDDSIDADVIEDCVLNLSD